MKGKIAAYHQNVGQVLSEGNVYNFHIRCVQGAIINNQEFEFELDEHGKVKVIYGNGAEKPLKWDYGEQRTLMSPNQNI